MVDLAWGSEESKQFITNVGLITSNGPYGHNIQAAEWTHHVSYSPGMIAVCFGLDRTTLQNVRQTKFFGVNLAAIDQNVVASIAGGSHGKDVDKIGALQELGVKFFKAKMIDVLMVERAALQVECGVVEMLNFGDHVLCIGEAVFVHKLSGNEPLSYHGGKYFKLGEQLIKPLQPELDRIKSIVEKHKKSV